MEQILQNKVIVISGGTKGVGRAMAVECAARGASVVIGGRDAGTAREIIKGIGNRGLFVRTELSDAEDCAKLFDEAAGQYGRVDGFFGYAGITPLSPLDSCTPEVFDNIMSINFRSAFFCCQNAIKYMRQNGGGSIILTGSAHAWGGQKDRAAYACSKGALLTLMEHIAHNYATERIRCNYLTLGWTPTEGEVALRAEQGISEETLRRRAAGILPMGRMLEYGDYIEGIVYLLSDASSMMTGSVFRITGGEYI
jgi:NAD(P)-dependent dehydrogenase (short-subunit alcohol dehydrogenase family)